MNGMSYVDIYETISLERDWLYCNRSHNLMMCKKYNTSKCNQTRFNHTKPFPFFSFLFFLMPKTDIWNWNYWFCGMSTLVGFGLVLWHMNHCTICRWCNGYRRRKLTQQHEFKSWTRLISFHIALIPLGKVWIQLFSLQLWVNSRTD